MDHNKNAPKSSPPNGSGDVGGLQAEEPPAIEHPLAKMKDQIDDDYLSHEVLTIVEGSHEHAKKKIDNPDSLLLQKHPEIAASIESKSFLETTSDWETIEDPPTQESLKHAVEEKTKISPAAPPAAPFAPVSTEEEKHLEDDPREHLNIVFVGHVDAGKSTLSGNILYLTGIVDKQAIERYERKAKEQCRESWFSALIMDTPSNEEKERQGKTVNVGHAYFETKAKRYTIIDAPSRKKCYVANMIMGASSQADIGVLVVSARKGEFEAGFDIGGQTRQHAILAKTLSVSFLVVAINKMDDPTVQWGKGRFDECVAKLRPFLKRCGFAIKREVYFIPISGMNGANVKDEVDPSVCPWWKELCDKGGNNTSIPTLLGLLDSLKMSGRDAMAPLRIPILESNVVDHGTITIIGKVESGIVRPGMKVTIMPMRNVFRIKEVWVNETSMRRVGPGENVFIKAVDEGVGGESVQKGHVLCTSPVCRAVSKLICIMVVVDMPENTHTLTPGFQAIFHAHTCQEECTIIKIFETTNTKGVTNKQAQYVKVNDRCVCILEFNGQTVSVEKFDEAPFLGQFTLRTEGKTIGIGKIIKLPPEEDCGWVKVERRKERGWVKLQSHSGQGS